MDKDDNTKEFEWKKRLTPEEYRVLRKKGTEAPYSGELLDNKEEGVYLCKGCSASLFSSETKFDSESGWPSFLKPIKEGAVAEESDGSLGMRRTEVLCNKCGGHLGHVFTDGPTTDAQGKPMPGLRYCINSVALKFKEEGSNKE